MKNERILNSILYAFFLLSTFALSPLFAREATWDPKTLTVEIPAVDVSDGTQIQLTLNYQGGVQFSIENSTTLTERTSTCSYYDLNSGILVIPSITVGKKTHYAELSFDGTAFSLIKAKALKENNAAFAPMGNSTERGNLHARNGVVIATDSLFGADPGTITASLVQDGLEMPSDISLCDSAIRIAPTGGLNYGKEYSLSLQHDGSPLQDLVFTTGARTDEFFVGGVIIDGFLDAVYGDKWTVEELFDALEADGGIQNYRLGVTTQENPEIDNVSDPLEFGDHPFSADYWSSREYTAYMIERGGAAGSHNSVFLFLSGTATHAGKYATENEWDTLSNEELLTALEEYGAGIATYFQDRDIAVDQFEIGNEVDFGIAGFYTGNRDVPDGWDFYGDLDSTREFLWSNHVAVINAVAAGIRSVRPDARIVVHMAAFTYSPEDMFVYEFYQYLLQQNVDFDAIGLSYPYVEYTTADDAEWPYFKTDRFRTVLKLLGGLGKPIQFSEFAYPKSDVVLGDTPAGAYPLTPEGQAQFLGDFLTEIASDPNVEGAYYFYPDVYTGMNGSTTNTLGLFDENRGPEPGMDVIRQINTQFKPDSN